MAVVNISTTQAVRQGKGPVPSLDEDDPMFDFFRRFVPRHPGAPRIEPDNRSLDHHFVPFAFLAAVLACDENDQSVTGPPHTHPGFAVTSIPLSGGPWGVGMSSRGSVFVTQAAATFVTRVAVDSDTVAQSYAVGSGPYDASFNAAETKLYVTTLYDGMVRALNPATGTVIDTISAPPEPVRVLLGPGETKLYVTQADGRLQVFNPTTHALDTTLTLGGVPLNDIVLSRSGTRLYVSSVGGTVTEVNTSTDAVTRSYTPGGKPQDLIVSPGDSILYVANEGGWVEVWNIMAWTRRDSPARLKRSSSGCGRSGRGDPRRAAWHG